MAADILEDGELPPNSLFLSLAKGLGPLERTGIVILISDFYNGVLGLL